MPCRPSCLRPSRLRRTPLPPSHRPLSLGIVAALVLLGCGGRQAPRVAAGVAPAEVEAPFVWGVSGHPARASEAYGYEDDPARLDRQMRLVRELGFSHYRVDVGVEMDGGERGRLAEVADAAERFGVTLLPVLTFGPAAVPRDRDEAYRAGRRIGEGFARRHGSRFPVVEVGNELDIPAMVDGHPVGHQTDHYRPPQVDRFAALLRGAIEGLREGAPTVRTIVNFAQSHTGFVRLLLERDVPFDIVGWHVYIDETGYGNDPEHRADYRATLERLERVGREIWITEVNRHRGSGPGNARMREQAAVLDRLAGEMAAHPLVGAFIVYQLFDELAALAYGNEDEAYYGLVHCAGPLEVARRCGGVLELKPAFAGARARGRRLALRSP
jgi:hypothetical protein